MVFGDFGFALVGVFVMSLKNDLTKEMKAIFSNEWSVQKTQGVPSPEDLRLNSNHAKDLNMATVLYADLNGSTNMVDKYDWQFSAEVYKAYLRCASQIIRSEGGEVTAYDGDRVMAVFTGKFKNTSAVKSAMKIHFAVGHIIKPALKNQYPQVDFDLKHVVGVDTSPLRAARIGVKGDNDLVWIGRAANYAAKLTNISGESIWITKAVYDAMNKVVKYSEGADIWRRFRWKAMGDIKIYSTDYYYPFG